MYDIYQTKEQLINEIRSNKSIDMDAVSRYRNKSILVGVEPCIDEYGIYSTVSFDGSVVRIPDAAIAVKYSLFVDIRGEAQKEGIKHGIEIIGGKNIQYLLGGSFNSYTVRPENVADRMYITGKDFAYMMLDYIEASIARRPRSDLEIRIDESLWDRDFLKQVAAICNPWQEGQIMDRDIAEERFNRLRIDERDDRWL